MVFDPLSILAFAASEAHREPAAAPADAKSNTGGAASSSSNDSASTMTFSPQLTSTSVKSSACPLHPRDVTLEADLEVAESTPSSPGGGGGGGGGYTEYECGYCGERKVSTSTGGDGRVRIRCECGGKHGDRKARMHAKWTLCAAVEPTHGKTSKSRRRAVFRPWAEGDEAGITAETR